MLRHVIAGVLAISAALVPTHGAKFSYWFPHRAQLAGEAPQVNTMQGKGETTLAEVSDLKFDKFFELKEVPEPSSLCYIAQTDTMFVVDDGDITRPAGLYELDMDCKVLRGLQVGKDDEGICFDPVNGRLYMADETDDRVWVIDRSGKELKAERSFTVSHDYKGKPFTTPGGNGYEGIEFMADATLPEGGYLLLLNQDDPSALVRLNMAQVNAAKDGAELPIEQAWELEQINCGELRFDPARNELWVIHSWMNTAEVLDPCSFDLLRWEVMPAAAQEGVCWDKQHRLWIGQDLGGVARYLDPLP